MSATWVQNCDFSFELLLSIDLSVIYSHFSSESSLLLYVNQFWGTVSSSTKHLLCVLCDERLVSGFENLLAVDCLHCKNNQKVLRVSRWNCLEICKPVLILSLSLLFKCSPCLDHSNFRKLTLLPCNLHSVFNLMQNFPLLQLGREYPSFPDVDIWSRRQLKVFWNHMVWLMDLDWLRQICLKSLRGWHLTGLRGTLK